MFSINTYISPLVSLLSIWTMSGVMLHDAQIDAAAITALSPKTAKSQSKTSVTTPDPHTHPDHRSPLKSKHGQPRIQPKRETCRVSTTERKIKKQDYSLKP